MISLKQTVIPRVWENWENSEVVRIYAGQSSSFFVNYVSYVFPWFPSVSHWIGLRENLQETMVFTIKSRAFLEIFP